MTCTVSDGNGGGYSWSTSWGSSWGHSHDTTVSYPGFSEARYYGRDYGGGSGEEDYIAYLGDAFNDATGPFSGGLSPVVVGELPSLQFPVQLSAQGQELFRYLTPSLRRHGSSVMLVAGRGDRANADSEMPLPIAGSEAANASLRKSVADAREVGDTSDGQAASVSALQGGSSQESWWRSLWEYIKEWLWAMGTTISPPHVAALEGTPHLAQIALIKSLKDRASAVELQYGFNSPEAVYAWREYEHFKAGGPRALEEFYRRHPPPPRRPGFPPFCPAWEEIEALKKLMGDRSRWEAGRR